MVRSAAGRDLPAHLAFLRDRLRPAPSHAGVLPPVLPFGDPRVDQCFPLQGEQRGLPLGALHEIGTEGRGAETGELPAAFAAALIGGICTRLRGRAPVLWVATVPDLYPPGLPSLDPARLVLVNPRDIVGVLAAMEVALREGGFAAVVGEVGAMAEVASRRLAFACQKHSVTAFILRRWPHGQRMPDRQASAATTRWLLASAPAGRWQVRLTHMRGGHTGSWLMEVGDGTTHPVRVVAALADHTAAADFERGQATGDG
ncbi:MAG: protein imuA [Acetobacteraceae bacterium]|nr:protein imuA [Acetobacteraceae bacterium]